MKPIVIFTQYDVYILSTWSEIYINQGQGKYIYLMSG